MSKTIKVQIKHRYTDAVLFEADIPADTPAGLQTRAALEKATAARATLAGANLARANLDGANLARANLAGATLAGATLAGANLAGATLAGANLDGATLAGANLDGAKVLRKVAQVRRDDGYEFIAFAMDDGRTVIRAGCRTMTPEQFREHVAANYPGTPKAEETLSIIAFIEGRAAALAKVGEALL